MQTAPGAEVDCAAEQFGQLVAEVGDLPAEPGTGREYVEQVEVAVRAFLAARTGVVPDPFTARPAARQITLAEAAADVAIDAFRRTPLGWWPDWRPVIAGS